MAQENVNFTSLRLFQSRNILKKFSDNCRLVQQHSVITGQEQELRSVSKAVQQQEATSAQTTEVQREYQGPKWQESL